MPQNPPYEGLPVAEIDGGPYDPIKVRVVPSMDNYAAQPVYVVNPATDPNGFFPVEVSLTEGIPVFVISGVLGSPDPEPAPDGFVFVVDDLDGAYLTDIDGYYLVTPA